MRRVVVLAVALVVVATVGVSAHPWPGPTAAVDRDADHRHRHRPPSGAESAAVERGRDVEPARRAAIRGGGADRRGGAGRIHLPPRADRVVHHPRLRADAGGVDVGAGDGDAAGAGRARRRRVRRWPCSSSRSPPPSRRHPTGARVRVWSVLVVAAPGVGPGRQVWRTVTLDMVEAGGRWLVDGWASTPGPTPAPPAEGAFDDAAAFVEPLGWPPASAPATAGAG